MREVITYSKRIVVKLGTALLTNKNGSIDFKLIKNIVSQIAELMKDGREIFLVSSGAIGAGFPFLNLNKRPKTLPLLQAAASLGQAKLMRVYDDLFSEHNINAAQILLTRDDLKYRNRHLNIRNTLNALVKNRILPIINENDTVSVDEIKFGDNDLLSALVSNLIRSDILINLTSVDGLYKKSDDGKTLDEEIIDEVKGVPSSVFGHIASDISTLGSGGMKTKLKAAKMVTTAGEFMVIANGREKNILQKILSGEHIGTLFTPNKSKMGTRKRWIAFFHQAKGKLYVDNGAYTALIKDGKSLLPTGITSVEGNFKPGDIVYIYTQEDIEIGKGLVNFSHNDLKIIAGHHTNEIEKLLGVHSYDEVIHRNNLVITYC
ncbi:glutamate 5-kinase [bacterium]|nr:glutamate 5-kinase [bacterium]